MDEIDYKYDIAFSFLAADEHIADALNSIVCKQFSTFLYSKRQDVLAGADGVEVFSEVFREQARLVVILYRNSWGKTDWTRLEETAIKSRLIKYGANSMLLIKIDRGDTAPSWFPIQMIWMDYELFGLDGTAAIIANRVREVGGIPHEETAVEKAKRIQHDSTVAEERKRFLDSKEGAKAAWEENHRLWAILKRSVDEIANETEFHAETAHSNDGYGIDAWVAGIGLKVIWVPVASNTLDGSELSISFLDGRPPRPGRWDFDDPPDRIAQFYYEIDRDVGGKVVWRAKNSIKLQSSEQLVEDLLKRLMGYSAKRNSR